MICDGIAYWGAKAGSLFALDARTGKLLWDFERSGLVYSKPALAGDVRYFGSGENLYALE